MFFWIKILFWRLRFINPKFDIFEGEKNIIIKLFNREYILNINEQKVIINSNMNITDNQIIYIDNFFNSNKKCLFLLQRNNIKNTSKPFFKIVRFLQNKNKYNFVLFEYPNFLNIKCKRLTNWIGELFISWKILQEKDINQLYFKKILDKQTK